MTVEPGLRWLKPRRRSAPCGGRTPHALPPERCSRASAYGWTLGSSARSVSLCIPMTNGGQGTKGRQPYQPRRSYAHCFPRAHWSKSGEEITRASRSLGCTPITCCSVTHAVLTTRGMKRPQRTKSISAVRLLERGFHHRKIFIGQGWVRGKETDLKTAGSYREIDMLPTVYEALEEHGRLESPWMFPNADGGRLNLDNFRHRIWYPTLARAGLRPRDLYQCRHTFASLMLQAGEAPAWVAHMMGHTTTKMLYERYHRFIQHRTRQDGALYLKRLKG